jgi:hypothetical protein
VNYLSVAEHNPSSTRTHAMASDSIPDAVHNGDTQIKANVHTIVHNPVSEMHFIYSRAKIAVIRFFEKEKDKSDPFQEKTVVHLFHDSTCSAV